MTFEQILETLQNILDTVKVHFENVETIDEYAYAPLQYRGTVSFHPPVSIQFAALYIKGCLAIF